MAKNPHGIFCLETIWFDERRPPSTKSLLELLERLSGIPFVHRDISTWEELDFCLGRWCGRGMYKKDYQLGDLGILYLGFHGSPGQINLRSDQRRKSDDDSIDLDKLAESLEHSENQYSLSGSAIHFASCSVLRWPKRVEKSKDVERFKDRVGASCVSGYSRSVDSAPSWAFELMYLGLLSNLMSERNVNAGTLDTLFRKLQKDQKYSGLAEALGFQMIF